MATVEVTVTCDCDNGQIWTTGPGGRPVKVTCSSCEGNGSYTEKRTVPDK